MSEQVSKSRTDKFVFVIESDLKRQDEIRQAFIHRKDLIFYFFSNPDDCLKALSIKPMVIFLDIEHFSNQNTDSVAIPWIALLKDKSARSEVIVFCDSEKEHKAAAALKMGAMDYVVLNPHQFAKMENELNWIEKVLFDRANERKQKIYLFMIITALILFIIFLIWLDFMGLIKEGSSPDLLIGD